jgi:hypothetical protein
MSYPFMNQEAIMATHPDPAPETPVAKRGRRQGENRAHLAPAEITAHQPEQNRSS